MLRKNIEEAVTFIKEKVSYDIEVGVVLGSGLSQMVDQVTEKITIPYEDIPHFKSSTVKGHDGALVFGKYQDKYVVMQSGRYHFYEGYSMEEVTFPIYVFKALNIKTLVLTNSCGGINETFKPGDLVVINDFINLMPTNPLIGMNDDTLGPRFPDMTEPFNVGLRESMKNAYHKHDVPYQEGIYAGFMGPYYETKAEIQMIKRMGADMVGMSTVPETIVANYLGLNTIAIATITNMATGIQKVKHSHDNVVKMAQQASRNLLKIMDSFLALI